MSDITKKIFSIEPVEAAAPAKAPISDMIRPVLADSANISEQAPKEEVPKFVTREVVSPLSEPPQAVSLDDLPNGSSVAGWILIGFGLAYAIGVGLYFGVPLLDRSTDLLSTAGLVLLVTLPLVLLFLLWRALGQLRFAHQQNARFSKAAEALVSPDREAYARSETLASAIRAQISRVNKSLSETVETLNTVQISVTKETQALDAAGLQLSSRSDDVGRNLTLQRQALESISGTFDTRMGTLSTQISATSDTLDVICTEAETKLLKASESLQLAAGKIDKSVADGSASIAEKVTEIGEVSRKLDETSEALAEDIGTSTKKLLETDDDLLASTEVLKGLNASTRGQISDLHVLIKDCNQMLANLREGAETRGSMVQSYYDTLASQLKQSENDTLEAQGKTARMVESNLAQMRRDFGRMETDLQALQAQLRNIRTATQDAEAASYTTENPSPRLNLKPLETDFPPVEPPRPVTTPVPSRLTETMAPAEAPLNLGMDMEIASLDDEIADLEPDVIRRPGDTTPNRKSKGFGRRVEKDSGTGWRWREMLGGLDRPDGGAPAGGLRSSIPIASAAASPAASPSVDGVEILTKLKLSPSAIVDEGTVIDATQARINDGEAGLVRTVSQKLPEAVAHLKDKLSADSKLIGDLKKFSENFATMIGNTPPTAPALRAALGSPDGRAYLLCVAALKG